MNPAVIHYLNSINQRFYQTVSAAFDETRGLAWPGWLRLLPYLTGRETVSVLDVGCGNGRFGVFLAQNLPGCALVYHGQDNNADLLGRARAALADYPLARARYELRDVVTHPPDDGAYDLVVAFGLLHHVPGAAQRLALVRTLAERTAPGGMLVFACWRFYEDARLRQRIIAWDEPWQAQVEPGDYLLDWRRGEPALRYCHYVDDAEHARLAAAAGIPETTRYRADGPGGTANCYSILQRGHMLT